MRVLPYCFAVAAALQAQPQVNGVSNDANRVCCDTITPGSVFAAFGFNLGRSAAAGGFPLREELAGTSVRVTVGGTTVAALMLESTEGLRVRAILPSHTPVGAGVLTVTYNGRTSTPRQIRVVRRQFGIFHSFSNVNSVADWQNNSPTAAARPGQLVALWGTGLGPVAGDEAGGPLPQAFDLPDLEVLVGDKPVRVLYAGRSGCCAGVDQIVFEAPAGVEGCYVPVVVRFLDAGEDSNYATLSIARDGGSCSDPFGLPAVLQEKQGRLRIGHMRAWSAAFGLGTAHVLPPFGTCNEWGGGGIGQPNLDAGPVLNFRTPHGLIVLQRPRPIPGHFQSYYLPGDPGPPLDPGEYSIDNGEGGTDVGPFQTTFNVPALSFTWSNRDSLSAARRSEAIRVTWSGGDPTQGYVLISGSFRIYSEDVGIYEGLGGFLCTERADKGSFSIPLHVLWRARVPLESRQGAPTFLDLSVGFQAHHRFEAPGLDLAEFLYSMGGQKPLPVE